VSDQIYAVIDAQGLIVNRIVGAVELPGHLCVREGDTPFEIGGSYIDGVYTPPFEPPIEPLPPPPISDRQFFQQLASVGIISEAEALAANAAVIPPPLLAVIEALPAEQQFAAKMLVSGATVFERDHPMTVAIGAAYGWSPAEIDDFFRDAAQL